MRWLLTSDRLSERVFRTEQGREWSVASSVAEITVATAVWSVLVFSPFLNWYSPTHPVRHRRLLSVATSLCMATILHGQGRKPCTHGQGDLNDNLPYFLLPLTPTPHPSSFSPFFFLISRRRRNIRAEGYERKVGLRIALCSAAADSLVAYLMRSHRWQLYTATGAAAAAPVRGLLQAVSSFPVSPVWAGFGWMWAGDAVYYGIVAAVEKAFFTGMPSAATSTSSAPATGAASKGEGAAADDEGGAGGGTKGEDEGAAEDGESGSIQTLKAVAANGKKPKAALKKRSSNGASGAVVQLTGRCIAAGIAAPCTALMLRAALPAAGATGTAFSSLLLFSSSPAGPVDGRVNVLLATVGCRIVSVALQDAVVSRTQQYLHQQLQAKHPLLEWVDSKSTAAMYVGWDQGNPSCGAAAREGTDGLRCPP